MPATRNFATQSANGDLSRYRWRRVCHGIDEVLGYRDEIESQRDELPYEIDGLVVKVNDSDFQQRLGQIARSPRWAIAYKFKPRQATTRILDIQAPGRTHGHTDAGRQS